MKCKKEKCEALLLGMNNPLQWCRLGFIGKQLSELGLGVLEDSKVDMSQQHALVGRGPPAPRAALRAAQPVDGGTPLSALVRLV